MDKLVAIIAPKGPRDWLVKVVALVLMVIAVNAVIVRVVLDREPSLYSDSLITFITGTPFVILGLAMVSHL
ncbi:hypothetical protein LQ948_06190 [Jiella sp. MQZ9-1]|uniref:Uncharacterized protein n=1 Tax=Jiella flava TaxID=2816857 RepID=A0A939JVE5_9HYPH|nr:hypothetical protein [Jiella flava]MBO0662374.1 hypothetical protein [Jiella flava]MCD2470795.1 hypothetical protein [Jiella flava]